MKIQMVGVLALVGVMSSSTASASIFDCSLVDENSRIGQACAWVRGGIEATIPNEQVRTSLYLVALTTAVVGGVSVVNDYIAPIVGNAFFNGTSLGTSIADSVGITDGAEFAFRSAYAVEGGFGAYALCRYLQGERVCYATVEGNVSAFDNDDDSEDRGALVDDPALEQQLAQSIHRQIAQDQEDEGEAEQPSSADENPQQVLVELRRSPRIAAQASAALDAQADGASSSRPARRASTRRAGATAGKKRAAPKSLGVSRAERLKRNLKAQQKRTSQARADLTAQKRRARNNGSVVNIYVQQK